MKKICLLSIFTVLTTIASTLALVEKCYSLDNTEWAHIASACPVDEDDRNLYEYVGAKLQFKGSATGRIDARCNVLPLDEEPINYWQVLYLTYQDPDGVGTKYRVRAIVYEVLSDPVDPPFTANPQQIAVFDSNTFSDTAATTKYITFHVNYNFRLYAYYVNLIIERRSTVAKPMVSVVKLRKGIY